MFMIAVQSRFIAKRYPEMYLLPWVFAVSMMNVVVGRNIYVGHAFMPMVEYSLGTVVGVFAGTRIVNNWLYFKVFKEKDTE